ncbi:MAG: UDP-N-acetylmuramoyl-L-alanyl-D-glutamate--2,6-diaminopimelate ligase [Eubacteriales bacterium]|nr:UDP-N-acetylmuramoyl-L-alanyl-D-glutamate--2,6-diaminopimelate ligase [Clostridiales bacterium]MDY2982708.1 UDP-N-acetylmuramoyl-L-alanyl-D-glutamate--2,6-diaminopimelate ligase [Eubacteriales bacterium]
MELSRIAQDLGIEYTGPQAEITAVDYDSRKVGRGSLFCCLVGEKTDGHNFASMAVEKGASALICQRPLPLNVPQLIVPDGREAMARAAACFYGHPERELTMLAVTGTNGKTSVTYMVKSVAETAGKKVGLIGTIQNLIGEEKVYTERTTPESVDLFALLRRMADKGVELVVMEVSSHALAQQRVAGIPFKAGLFTNLTQDHLDYHKTFENYRAAKKKLFAQCGIAILNGDDETAAYMKEGLSIPVWTMGIHHPGEFYARGIEITTQGASFHLFTPQGNGRISLHISGLFSVYNAMGTAALCTAAGIPFSCIVKGLEGLRGVAGRLECVDTGDRPFSVYVDYAHTPDALQNVLETARGFTRRRLISVFGCGGDRDHGKRPIMGEIGGRYSDHVILTSDNPRTEDPMDILKAVEEGVKRTATPYIVTENRREAIREALEEAGDGDVIVIAGKGHESYQEINGVRHHFDDKEIVLSLLRGE